MKEHPSQSGNRPEPDLAEPLAAPMPSSLPVAFWLVVAITLVCAVCLPGCGGGDAEPEPDPYADCATHQAGQPERQGIPAKPCRARSL